MQDLYSIKSEVRRGGSLGRWLKECRSVKVVECKERSEREKETGAFGGGTEKLKRERGKVLGDGKWR